MDECLICHFTVSLDDVSVLTPRGRCVCLGCYARQTETVLLMSKQFRRAISEVLEATAEQPEPSVQRFQS